MNEWINERVSEWARNEQTKTIWKREQTKRIEQRRDHIWMFSTRLNIKNFYTITLLLQA